MAEKKEKFKLSLLGILAGLKSDEYDKELMAMLGDDGESVTNADLLTNGLKHESARGFLCGVMACIGVIDGDDPYDLFREYVDSLEEASARTLEHAFSKQVEHYSETGEA